MRRENISRGFFLYIPTFKSNVSEFPTWATNAALFFTRIFKLKLIDRKARFVPSSLTTISDSHSCQLCGRILHIALKMKFKIADSKMAIPSCCHSSSFPQRSLLFWVTLKEGKVPEHNWVSWQASFSVLSPNLGHRKLLTTF